MLRRTTWSVGLFLSGMLFHRVFISQGVFAQSSKPRAGKQESAQTAANLVLGGVQVYIGMSKADALAAFEPIYAVSVKDERAVIFTKPTDDPMTLRFIGALDFEDNKVAQASLPWGDVKGTEVEHLWRLFWGALTSNTGDHK